MKQPTNSIQEWRHGRLRQEWCLAASDASSSTRSTRSTTTTLVPVSQAATTTASHQQHQQQQQQQRSGLTQLLVSAFMPVGWPGSVSSDYTGFVLWNLVQAVSSYVRGVLSSHAVFKGVGVGSEAATALGAVFQFFVRDILGMLGGILFALAAGGNFDSNAKQWRLFADVMNDVAMALDLASPLVPGAFMLLASLGSVSRAVVGMSAGATGAALTQHFAQGGGGGNAADISAKADARERATSIIGGLLGMAVTRHLAEHVAAAWVFFAVLTWVHVWANMRALRCLVLSSLNQPRLRLLLAHYEQHGSVLTPQQVSGLESLLVPPLASLLDRLRGNTRVHFGARLITALDAAATDVSSSSSSSSSSSTNSRGQQRAAALAQLLKQQPAAASRQCILVPSSSRRGGGVVHVVLHHSADPQVKLRAYLHALHEAAAQQHQAIVDSSWAETRLPAFLALLQQQGWALDKLYLPSPDWTASW